MEEKNTTGLGPHKFLVQGRKAAELTGVKEVVSFDIFDTLVLRKVSKPTDVFQLMEFELKRKKCKV